MTLRRWIPMAAVAVAAWMPADASAQDPARVRVGREADEATRRATESVDEVRRGADEVRRGADEARGGADEVARGRAATLTEREVLAKMASAERRHVLRLAKLDRLRELAEQSGNAERIRAVDELREKEIARRQRQIRNARALVGEGTYDRYARQLRDAREERRRRGEADRSVNERRMRNARKDAFGDDEVDPRRGPAVDPTRRGAVDPARGNGVDPARRRAPAPDPRRDAGTIRRGGDVGGRPSSSRSGGPSRDRGRGRGR